MMVSRTAPGPELGTEAGQVKTKAADHRRQHRQEPTRLTDFGPRECPGLANSVNVKLLEYLSLAGDLLLGSV